MINAEKAHRIMELYESDYDNFLDKLRAKHKAKKAAAKQKKSEADKAGKTLNEAETHKKIHLGEKAQNLLDKFGGIQGAKDTVQNVMNYAKSDVPSDYAIDIGAQSKRDDASAGKIMGMPSMVVYLGSALIFIGGLYGLSRMMKNKNQTKTEQILQAA